MIDKNEEERRSNLHAALLEILDEALTVDQAACGKIRVYDPVSDSLEIRAQRGFSDGFVNSFRAVSKDEPVACARAFRLRHRVTVPDISADPLAEPYRAAARDEGFKAMQVTPLIGTGGRVVGTLSTHFPRIHHPSASAALVLDYLSRKAASIIEALFAPRVGQQG